MELLKAAEKTRLLADKELDKEAKAKHGQYFTPASTCKFMASLFTNFEGQIELLDAGCGVASLSAAFIDEVVRRRETTQLRVECYDIDQKVEKYVHENLTAAEEELKRAFIPFDWAFFEKDFIKRSCTLLKGKGRAPSVEEGLYTHAILNPPYGKIGGSSIHGQLLKKHKLNSVNLYSAFMALAVRLLKANGELVAIVPRSFCNGTYYKGFRHYIEENTAIRRIHLFESRQSIFSDGNVLQENIIIHLIKGGEKTDVVISTSVDGDFENTQTNVVSSQSFPYQAIIKTNDKQKFIHIPTSANNASHNGLIERMPGRITDVDADVSTGPVVDFRHVESLRKRVGLNCARLIFPAHLSNRIVKWPISSKPNAIRINQKSDGYIWKDEGAFVIVKRISSKEEERRIVAAIYSGEGLNQFVGFDNKLNIIHRNKQGLPKTLANGICAYLNSTALDNFYRVFGGHTQVNVSDIKSLPFPTKNILEAIGKCYRDNMTQSQIDMLIRREIQHLPVNSIDVEKTGTK